MAENEPDRAPDAPGGEGDGPRVADFDYDLPPERIAQAPARPRDASRLLALDRATGAVSHHRFRDLPDLLRPADLVVLNDTRVLPAALTARRASGGRIDGCFLRTRDDGAWEVLLSGRGRLREGETLVVVDAGDRPHASVRLESRGEGGVWTVRPTEPVEALAVLEAAGRPPLPPYIRRDRADPRTAADRADYQTVYARQAGAVAAPTAGLHFTDRVLARLEARGIERATVTLHVGLGTFQPVRAARPADHCMHEEWLEISPAAAEAVTRARQAGRRVVAVGTTTVRALESAAEEDGTVRPGRAWTDLFIYPPHAFRVAGAMVTNFHLPRTTLLMMVSAFAGRDRVLAAYREAVREGYRFYSYGDAMLIG
ncbi:MAG: tRNA preQ1(34) S-adenosylmethionine ribosyltransferase-isomerase QueA [Phycisphaerae bacterium]